MEMNLDHYARTAKIIEKQIAEYGIEHAKLVNKLRIRDMAQDREAFWARSEYLVLWADSAAILDAFGL